MTEHADVTAFRVKFEQRVSDSPVHLTPRRLAQRANFLLEEVNEFIDAGNEQDLAKQADALVDIVYVAIGTAILMGLPWQALWDDVQAANMRKVLGPKGDVIKPPGWVGPDTEAILTQAGYDLQNPVTIDDPGRPR